MGLAADEFCHVRDLRSQSFQMEFARMKNLTAIFAILSLLAVECQAGRTTDSPPEDDGLDLRFIGPDPVTTPPPAPSQPQDAPEPQEQPHDPER
jgi:hypothetical protein